MKAEVGLKLAVSASRASASCCSDHAKLVAELMLLIFLLLV
jgi:hypothetical protein